MFEGFYLCFLLPQLRLDTGQFPKSLLVHLTKLLHHVGTFVRGLCRQTVVELKIVLGQALDSILSHHGGAGS